MDQSYDVQGILENQKITRSDCERVRELIRIYVLTKHRKLMSLQYKSILKYVTDTDTDIEYVIVNNARTPKMIPIYKNILKKPTIEEISRIPSLLSAPLRKIEIRLTAKMLGIRMIFIIPLILVTYLKMVIFVFIIGIFLLNKVVSSPHST
jgi:hypothetical protein